MRWKGEFITNSYQSFEKIEAKNSKIYRTIQHSIILTNKKPQWEQEFLKAGIWWYKFLLTNIETSNTTFHVRKKSTKSIDELVHLVNTYSTPTKP